MSRKKASALALGVVLVVVAVLPFRTTIRKAWRHSHPRHAPSKGMLKNPEGLAFDREGRLWVCDSDNHRLKIYTPEGKLLRIID